MHDLQLVGVHDDGEHLLLTGTDGQRYRLRIDEAVRAAVRRDRARMGQLQIEMDGGVRPRDIQARIRSGESAEDVAAAAGLPVEHVRRYEGPVLAERAHVADLARRLSVRHGDRRLPFGELVAERLTGRGVDVDAVVWDAWRREGSTWQVQLGFHAGSRERRACWLYDLSRSHLEPQDDEARWLASVEDRDEDGAAGRRLSAVRERVYDVEADGGVRDARTPRGGAGRGRDDAAAADPTAEDCRDEPATGSAAVEAGGHQAGGHQAGGHQAGGHQAGGHEAGAREAGGSGRGDRHRTLDLLDALRDRRGRRQPLALPDELDELDEDPTGAEPAAGVRSGDAATDEPPAAHPAASRPEEATDAEVLVLPDAPVDHPAAEPAEPDEPDEPDEPAEPAATAGTGPGDTYPAGGDSSGGDSSGGDSSGSTGLPDRAGPAPGDRAEPGDDAREPATAGARNAGARNAGVGERSRQPAGSRSRGGSKRASVPSWDEIMFGAKRD